MDLVITISTKICAWIVGDSIPEPILALDLTWSCLIWSAIAMDHQDCHFKFQNWIAMKIPLGLPIVLTIIPRIVSISRAHNPISSMDKSFWCPFFTTNLVVHQHRHPIKNCDHIRPTFLTQLFHLTLSGRNLRSEITLFSSLLCAGMDMSKRM